MYFVSVSYFLLRWAKTGGCFLPYRNWIAAFAGVRMWTQLCSSLPSSPRSPNKLLMFRCGNLQPPLDSWHVAPVDPAGLPPRGAGEVKMAYVMLTGADGFPKVLNNLCLHCANRKLVYIFSSLPFFFFYTAQRSAAVSLAYIPLRPPPGSFPSYPFLPPSHGHLLWKDGTPRPRQHNRSSVDSGGGVEWGWGVLCGLFYLISVSTRASVWCKRVGVSLSPSLRPLLPILLPNLSLGCLSTPSFSLHHSAQSAFAPLSPKHCKSETLYRSTPKLLIQSRWWAQQSHPCTRVITQVHSSGPNQAQARQRCLKCSWRRTLNFFSF